MSTASHLLIVHLQEDSGSIFSVSSQQAVVGRGKVSTSPLPQAEQMQFSVPLLLCCHVLQSPDHLAGLCWTHCRMSTSFLHWGPQNWMQHPKCGIEGLFPRIHRLHSCLGCGWPPLLRGCTANAPQMPFFTKLVSSLSALRQLSDRITQSYPTPDTGLQLCFLWTSQGSCQPFSPGCPGPSK